MSNAVRENIKRTTQATIDAYNKWDLDAILAPRTDDCVYQFRPLSLQQPARNNTEYREYYSTQIIPLLQDFKATVSGTIIDAEDRKSVVHCFCEANSPVGKYGPIEIVLMMTFNDTGERVTQMDEFFDSTVLVEFLQRVESFVKAQSEQR